jgi:hypothetical protein
MAGIGNNFHRFMPKKQSGQSRRLALKAAERKAARTGPIPVPGRERFYLTGDYPENETDAGLSIWLQAAQTQQNNSLLENPEQRKKGLSGRLQPGPGVRTTIRYQIAGLICPAIL